MSSVLIIARKNSVCLIAFFGAIAVLLTACTSDDSGAGNSADSSVTSSQNADTPNVLFIIVDDLNTQVGFLGDDSASTPRMDTLASESIVFEHAYAQAPICNPSRVSFLTGIYPHSTGLYGQKPEFWEVSAYDQIATLPLHFRNNGYHTASIGKVTNFRRHKPSFDYTKGWFGAFGPFPEQPLNRHPDSPYSKYYDWGPFLEDHETADYKVASAAIEYLGSEEFGDAPFFLAVGFFRPHAPLFSPKKYFDLHPSGSIDVPAAQETAVESIPDFAKQLVSYNRDQKFKEYLAEPGRAQGFLQAYGASVSLADSQIGRVLDSLAESRHAENTVIVVISDNGVQNGAKNLWFKRTLWEKTLRVPMMVYSPERPARRIEMPVGLIDLYPTLSELAGLSIPAHVEGVSLLPWIDAPRDYAGPSREPVIAVHGPGNVSIRDSRWRYIRYEDGSEELYDHSNDPYESKNLAIANSVHDIQSVLEGFRVLIPSDFSDFAPGTGGMASAAYPGK